MSSPERAIRRIARDQAIARMKTLTVQGKLATLNDSAMLRTLEPGLHSSVTIPNEWKILSLPNDPPSALDLFPSTYRITRSIGGSWTELFHSDSNALLQARS